MPAGQRYVRFFSRSASTAALLTLLGVTTLCAAADRAAFGKPIAHFVYFGLERDRIRDMYFLETQAIAGAQLKYTWRELEPERDRYDLEPLLADLEFLERNGKRLFVQLQDVSFSPEIVNVPNYLREDSAFGGGVALQYALEGDDESTARPEGWVARRWDPLVRERFVKLLGVMGRELDGRIEGLNLPETSIGFGDSGLLFPEGYSHEGYVEGIRLLMSAAGQAFPTSHVIQYANFMPGEWRPWTDKGYLKSIYEHAEQIGVGVGGPDLMPHRTGQQNHCLELIEARSRQTVAGLAVQRGNLEERNPATGKRVSVAELHQYGRDRLKLDYIFWGIQEPFYSEEVLPYLKGLATPTIRGAPPLEVQLH